MPRFGEGKLGACMTSVVEVGVDVPECDRDADRNAEQFGLAQLHQPGTDRPAAHPSHCIPVPAPRLGRAMEQLRVLGVGEGRVCLSGRFFPAGPGDLAAQSKAVFGFSLC